MNLLAPGTADENPREPSPFPGYMVSDSFYTRFFHFFLLSVLVVICYSNSFTAPWHFDDTGNIVNNPSIEIKDLSWGETLKALHFSVKERGPYTRPIASLTFAINYLMSGYDTTSYHVVNVGLHLLTAFIIYFIFIETINLYVIPASAFNFVLKKFPSSNVALLGSVFWAVHPLHTQAVTYIVQRQTVLAAMFYLSAMYLYIRARLAGKMHNRVILLFLVILLYLLGVGSKQNAALLPLALIGYEVAFFRYPILGMIRTCRWVQILLLGAVVVGGVLLALKGRQLSEYLLSAYGHRPFTLGGRLLTEPIVLWKYLFLIITPLSDFLVLESDMVASRSLFDPPVTLAAVVSITLLAALCLFFLRKIPIFCYAFFFFFANHLVESTFIGLELYFEHRNYLPSVFIYFCLAYFMVYLLNYYRNKMLMKFIFILLITSFVVSSGNATYLRNDVWSDNISILEDSISKAPGNMRAYISVSTYYVKLKMYEKARKRLKEAEELYNANPGLYQINLPELMYYNAAVLYSSYEWERKDLDKAIALLYKSCSIYFGDYLPHMTLAALLFKNGNYAEAEKAMLNALAIISADEGRIPALLHRNLGRIYYSNGKTGEAIDSFISAMKLEPSDDLRLNLIAAYIKSGELSRARYLLYEVDERNDTPVYLLSKALLFPNEQGDKALKKLAGLLAQSGVSYCEWIEGILKNDSLGIIYPDIQRVEAILKVYFIEELEAIRLKTVSKISDANNCGS